MNVFSLLCPFCSTRSQSFTSPLFVCRKLWKSVPDVRTIGKIEKHNGCETENKIKILTLGLIICDMSKGICFHSCVNKISAITTKML